MRTKSKLLMIREIERRNQKRIDTFEKKREGTSRTQKRNPERDRGKHKRGL